MLPLGKMVNTASQLSAISAWDAALAPWSQSAFTAASLRSFT